MTPTEREAIRARADAAATALQSWLDNRLSNSDEAFEPNFAAIKALRDAVSHIATLEREREELREALAFVWNTYFKDRTEQKGISE